MCRFLSCAAPINPGVVMGGSYAVMVCEEHGHMPVGNIMANPDPTGEPLCPIGRIEKARDEAIEAIRRMANGPPLSYTRG